VLELPAGLEGAVEVDAVVAQGVLPADPVRVRARPQLVLVVHRPRGGAGAEERAAEAGALLVGPAHQPDRDGWRPVPGDAPQHLHARHDVERAVEPAAVGDGVDVAADDESALGVAPEREPLVARRVRLLLDPERGELAGEPLLRTRPRFGPRDALGAVLVARELAELAQLLDGAAWFERHGRNV
jgi:hypothetical protein